MSESKEPEGTPVAQESTAQQGTSTPPTSSPPTEGSAGAAGGAPPLADRIPDAPAGGGDRATPARPDAASAMEQALTAAMAPVAAAIEGARDAEQKALDAVQPAVKAMAAAVIAGGTRGTIEQTVQQTLGPVAEAMRVAQEAQQRALDAMVPGVTMQQELAAMPQIVASLRGVVEAERAALTAMARFVKEPAPRDLQGSVAANGASRDVAPSGNGMLRDTEGVLRDPTSGTDGAFFKQLTGVPIDYLIATPLMSCARANHALATVMCEFIDDIGFEKGGSSSEQKKTRLIKFNLKRPLKDNNTGEMKTYQMDVEAPLLALVPLPALLIDTVNIDLTVEISQKMNQTNKSSTGGNLQVGSAWAWGHASFTGNFTISEDRTRETNQTAKYNVKVLARQQPLPEGMSKLMDVFASSIEPLETTKLVQ